jgi:hypothetical protein
MKDELKRSFYVKTLSERYGIYESTLYRELEKLLAKVRTREKYEQQREIQNTTQNPPQVESSAETGQAVIQSRQDIPAAERDLLKLMLEHGNDMVGYVFSHLQAVHFTHPQVQKVLDMIHPHVQNADAWDANSIINETEDIELRRFIADITFSKYELSKGWEEFDAMPEEADPGEIASRCMIILKRQELEKLLVENQRHMKEAAAKGEELRNFVEHHQLLMKEKKDLETYGLSSERTIPE